MFVASSAWRRGVGRALMDAALDDLRERGYTAAVVWSFADNDRANAFYERMGFARDGAERSNAVWAHIPEVRYRRSLRTMRKERLDGVEPSPRRTARRSASWPARRPATR